MMDEVLAVCISKYQKEIYYKPNSLQIDFLFKSDNKEVVSIDNEFDFNEFAQNIENIRFKKNEKSEYYHVEHIKSYLKKYFPGSSKTLKLEMFGNNDVMVLCNILAKNGMIVLINSFYYSLLFLPGNLSIKQKESLKLLDSIIDGEMKFDCNIINGNKINKLTDITYFDILNVLGIEKDSFKKGL